MIDTPAFELNEYWEEKTNENNKIMDWIKSIAFNSKTIRGAKHLDIKKMLTELIILRLLMLKTLLFLTASEKSNRRGFWVWYYKRH